MAYINSNILVLTGNLTGTAQTKVTKGGSFGTKFDIAHNIRYKTRDGWAEKTIFMPVIRWSKFEPTDMDYLKKGAKVEVVGSLDLNEWQGREGEKHSKLEMKANSVQIISEARKPVEKSSEGTDSDDEWKSPSSMNDDDIPF